MCEHGSQKAPHTKYYVRAWKPKGAAYKVLCASMGVSKHTVHSVRVMLLVQCEKALGFSSIIQPPETPCLMWAIHFVEKAFDFSSRIQPPATPCLMCGHGRHKVPPAMHYVRAWRPKGATCNAICATMEAKVCRLRCTMCDHGSQKVPPVMHYVRPWKPDVAQAIAEGRTQLSPIAAWDRCQRAAQARDC